MRRLLPLLVLTLIASAASTVRADETVPSPAGDSQVPAAPTFTLGNPALLDRSAKVTLYGFIEADTILDSTQSFTELQGNTAIGKQGTVAGDNTRFQLGARNSRFGVKIESPQTDNGIKALGNFEMDFLGVAGGTAEANIYSTPTFRMRHGFVKVQSPWIDVLVGQTWTVFGSSMGFIPATVDIQGVPTEVYQRTLQIRLGKTVHAGDFTGELEVAALRPYQRDSGVPDFGGFVRAAWNGWRGYKASGATSGDESGIQLSFSALARKFRVVQPGGAGDTDFESTTGKGFALDAIIPIIPATKKDKNNALTFVGELTTGSGISDAFTSYNAGVTAITAPAGAPMGYAIGAGLDAGPAGFNKTTGHLDTLDSKSMLLSLQYFLPVNNGGVFVSLLYGALLSDNAVNFTSPAAALVDERYLAADLFVDVTSAARLGLSYGKTRQRFGDNSAARTNDRVQLSAFYIF